MITGSELRVLRLLFSNNRLTQYTGMDVISIEEGLNRQAESFNLKSCSNMKGLSLVTIRRCLRALVEKGLVGEGVKKETYKKTYYLNDNGVNIINSIIHASDERKELESKNK